MKKIDPKRIKLILIAIAVHMASYYVPKLFPLHFNAVDLTCSFDSRLPFIPFFIVFYIGAFIQWALGYYRLALSGEKTFNRFLNAEILGKIICIVFFILMPTRITRPEVTGTDLFSRLTAIIYFFDVPTNLFPSMHCLQSWLCMRLVLGSEKFTPLHKVLTALFTLCVIASTVLVKQHLIADTFAGVAAAELVLAVSTFFIRRKENRDSV